MSDRESPNRLVPTSEAARAFGVSTRTLSSWAQAGRVRPTVTTAGGHYRWDIEDLRRQLEQLRKTE